MKPAKNASVSRTIEERDFAKLIKTNKETRDSQKSRSPSPQSPFQVHGDTKISIAQSHLNQAKQEQNQRKQYQLEASRTVWLPGYRSTSGEHSPTSPMTKIRRHAQRLSSNRLQNWLKDPEMFFLLKKAGVITKDIINPTVEQQFSSDCSSPSGSLDNMHMKSFHFKSGADTCLQSKRATSSVLNADEVLTNFNIELVEEQNTSAEVMTEGTMDGTIINLEKRYIHSQH